jgi:hypothetical protein
VLNFEPVLTKERWEIHRIFLLRTNGADYY